MRKGISVSPGVAVGTAYCIHEIFVDPDTKRLEDNEVTAELANYETARDKAAAELRALHHKVAAQVGVPEAAIFAAHDRSCGTPRLPTKSEPGSSTTASPPRLPCTAFSTNTPSSSPKRTTSTSRSGLTT